MFGKIVLLIGVIGVAYVMLACYMKWIESMYKQPKWKDFKKKDK